MLDAVKGIVYSFSIITNLFLQIDILYIADDVSGFGKYIAKMAARIMRSIDYPVARLNATILRKRLQGSFINTSLISTVECGF
jgi:hypothetical protein